MRVSEVGEIHFYSRAVAGCHADMCWFVSVSSVTPDALLHSDRIDVASFGAA